VLPLAVRDGPAATLALAAAAVMAVSRNEFLAVAVGVRAGGF
jgi:hypothetical protein